MEESSASIKSNVTSSVGRAAGDLRVQVLRKMHAIDGGSLDHDLSVKKRESLSPLRSRTHRSGDESIGKSASGGSKRSKSLSPLFPRRRTRDQNSNNLSDKTSSNIDKRMTSTESITGGLRSNASTGNMQVTITGPSTPGSTSGNELQQQQQQDLLTSGTPSQAPDITVTSTHTRSAPANMYASGSGSETSPDSSDQQGVVVTFRKAAPGPDQRSGSEANSRSVSSENVSINASDRRSSNNSRKSSPVLNSESTTPVNGGATTPQPQPKPVGTSSPKAGKRERKLSSNGSSSTTATTTAVTSGQLTNNTSTSTTHLPQATEKTRLQSAASHLRNLLAPNYKSRAEEFRKLFKPPENDKFVIDYSCAYQREILVQGRMYMSQNWLCFYANILFKWETTLIIRFKDITSITKEKTAKVIPNAIQVCTKTGEKLFFTSFSMRDKAYMMMFKIWQNALLDQPMNPAELWTWAQHGYDEHEFSESDQEAEDALLTSFPDDPNDASRPLDSADRRMTASVPPMQSFPNGESIAPSENDSARSTRTAPGNVGTDEDGLNSYLLHPKPSKISRIGSGASSPGTTATTPAEEYTESENDTEVNCPCASHTGKEILNCVFPISVDQLFLLLFTDSVFFRKLHEDRKTTDLVLSDWQVDKGTATKSRQITYVVALNHSVGPKSCSVTEKQVCTTASKPGQLYVMKCDITNVGVPYSDTFSVGVQYCLSRVSANQCRIRVHAAVVYKKSCWGIVKSFIEKNALVGIQDFFSDLNTHLHAECARFGLTDGTEVETDNGKRSNSRLRNRASKTADEEDQALTRSPSSKRRASSVAYPLLPSEVENIAKGILLVLILMLLLNAALFYKLWYFESEVERGSFEHTLRDFEKILKTSDLSPSEWLRVFQQVRYSQKKQLAKWLEELDSAIKYVSDVEASLSEMRKQIGTMQKDIGTETLTARDQTEEKKVQQPVEQQHNAKHDSGQL